MIVRILGEGQYAVADEHAELLNGLDAGLERAVAAGDEAAFRSAVDGLLAKVRTVGERVPDDSLDPSDAVLPGTDTSLQEVREMLESSDEGLIPG